MLCIVRLARVILQVVEEGSWKPIFVGRREPPISHLMFMDNLLLFVEALGVQMEVVHGVLNRVCAVSGQNVSSAISGYVKSPMLGKYLGVPIVAGQLSHGQFQEVLDRFWSRLEGSASQCLSMARRLILAKSVL